MHECLYNMGNKLNGFRFFLEGGVAECLSMTSRPTDIACFVEGERYQFEIIEQPFSIEVIAESQSCNMDISIRNELGVLNGSDMHVVIPKGEGTPDIQKQGRIGGDGEKMVSVLFGAATALRKMVSENDWLNSYARLNPETEGLLVLMKDDEISIRKVSGRSRPNLACTTLFGGVQMSRPYEDEILDAWSIEGKSGS